MGNVYLPCQLYGHLELLRGQVFKSCNGCTAVHPFSHGSIVYTCKELLALRCPGLPFTDKLEIPAKSWRRQTRCRAFVKCLDWACIYKSRLPAIVMGNIHSFSNKMDELTTLTQLQAECFTKSWLHADIPDSGFFEQIKGSKNS